MYNICARFERTDKVWNKCYDSFISNFLVLVIFGNCLICKYSQTQNIFKPDVLANYDKKSGCEIFSLFHYFLVCIKWPRGFCSHNFYQYIIRIILKNKEQYDFTDLKTDVENFVTFSFKRRKFLCILFPLLYVRTQSWLVNVEKNKTQDAYHRQ